MAIDFSKYTQNIGANPIDFSKYTGGVSTGNIDFSKYTTGGMQPTAITPTDNILTKWVGIQNPTTYWQDAWNQVKTTVAHPIKAVENALGAGVGAITGAFKNVMNQPGNLLSNYTENKPISNKIADFANAISADVGAAFSPVGAVFAAAEQIPVLKQAADVVNGVFTATGNIVKFPVEGFIKALPIDQASKDLLAPAFGDLGALAGQIVLGGKVMEYVQAKVIPGKEVVIPKEDIVKLKEEAKTYTEQAKTNLQKTTKPTQVTEQPTQITKKIEIPQEKVNADAEILRGASQSEFKGDPEFQSKPFEQQARIFNEVNATDRAKAMDIATRRIPPPEGATSTAFAKLMREDANLTLEELNRLKDMPVAFSEAGSELVSTQIGTKGRVDPVKAVIDIEKAMEKTAEKTTPAKKAVTDIIKKLSC